MKNLILSMIAMAVFNSCQLKSPEGQESELTSVVTQQGIAKEVLQTSNYTYILIDNEGLEVWIAVPKMDAIVGEKYYFVQNMKMENFQSKELNRIFDNILFVQEIATNPDLLIEKPQIETEYKTEIEITKQNIKIDRAKGMLSIAEIFSNKDKYKGNLITVKGIVTKYNPEIMGKNWIHLQDGTESNGNFDLTATTLVNSKIGDTITLAGKLILDKDFGYGYKYDVLLEDAVIK